MCCSNDGLYYSLCEKTLQNSLQKIIFVYRNDSYKNSYLFKKKDLVIENDNNNPVAIQVGGSDFNDLKKCSKVAYEYNYDEINLNVGCPSKAVQKGSFGACLMQDKVLVRQCIESMQNKNIITSMKCRIGLGKNLNYDYFEEFIDEVLKSGIKIIYVHARNAILSGISPKANRTIPPLNYDFVKKIKLRFPNINFILNGGIDDFEKAKELIKVYDGIMVGRLIQNNPFILKNVDKSIYKEKNFTTINEDTILDYFSYINTRTQQESIYRLLSPLLQIFFGVPGSKIFKKEINETMRIGRLDKIEKIFLKFIKDKNFLLN